MKKLRPAIALSLIGAIAFNVLGYCFFSILILTHKKSTFYKLLHGEFEQAVLVEFKEGDVTNARWEHDREFELDGNMYDIVKIKNQDGSTIYLCKKDTREDHLKKQKRKAAEKQTAKKLSELNGIFVQISSIHEYLVTDDGRTLESMFYHETDYYSIRLLPELPPKI